VPEMVEEGVTGWLLPEHQPAALADALGRLLNDRDMARSLGKAGRARAEKLFGIENSARSLRALFHRLCAI